MIGGKIKTLKHIWR